MQQIINLSHVAITSLVDGTHKFVLVYKLRICVRISSQHLKAKAAPPPRESASVFLVIITSREFNRNPCSSCAAKDSCI